MTIPIECLRPNYDLSEHGMRWRKRWCNWEGGLQEALGSVFLCVYIYGHARVFSVSWPDGIRVSGGPVCRSLCVPAAFWGSEICAVVASVSIGRLVLVF